MKKLIRYIKIAFYSLFYGMRSADKMLSTSTKDNDLDANSVGGIEQEQEKQSVYKDLLKGEVTEQVRELRHEMYYSERKSKEYEYGGGGRAKKNNMFDYKGNVDKSDGHKILIVQQNTLIQSSLSESGVEVYGEKADISDNIGTLIRNKPRSEKEYRIKIERNGFIPKFKIENYLTKLVVKEIDENKVLIDLYITKYFDKFEKTSKLFHNEMEKIYQGLDVEPNTRLGGILNFNEIHFVSKDAYGVPDLVELSYVNFTFDTILEHDGHYILRYVAYENRKDDLIEEFYHEATAEKCEKHEMREGSTIDITNLLEKKTEEYDTDSAVALINNIYGK